MNKTTAGDTAFYLFIAALVAAFGFLVYIIGYALLDDSQEKFEGACDYLGGKVYVMDVDHRVCIKGGKVVLRDDR